MIILSSLSTHKSTLKFTSMHKLSTKVKTSKVFYKKDASLVNPKEAFCNILFDITIGDKLIEAVRKVL